MYSEKVKDHFSNPRNVGVVDNADAVGKVGNPTCGDIMEISIKVNDGMIDDIKFRTFGCGAAIATSSMTTELAKGRSLSQAAHLTKNDVADALDGLPPVKMHCSNLAVDALKDALAKYFEKHPETRPEDITDDDLKIDTSTHDHDDRVEEGRACEAPE
ncbi:MAG: Fe-S cluster assembly scaffold protein NifU [Planctomycetota bacterium]|jgi:nitrogen fixation NifU-like protein